MQKEICIGIDLGTTYSCVAYYESDGKVNIIVNENGHRITPSYVAFHGKERIIGDIAKKNCGQNSKNTIYDIKRLMGNNFKDIQSDLKHLTYNIVNDNDKPTIQVDYMDKITCFQPEQISAMILEYLKNMVISNTGYNVKKAVITVPAYFNDAQRQATKNAGQIAGLDVIRIINEPTAAAIAYGLHIKNERKVLVYDLGGGTLDVTILTIENGVFQVKSTSGDVHLGGEDFDNKLTDYCFMKFCDKYILTTKLSTNEKKQLFELLGISSIYDINCYDYNKLCAIRDKTNNIFLKQLCEVNYLYKNTKLLRRLKTACEDVKKMLSTVTCADVIYDNFYQGNDLHISITRSKFEEICDSEFKRCIEPIRRALCDAKLTTTQIDDIVLVGGSTRIPYIQTMLNELFPHKLRSTINPDEAVAHGAAINAAIISDMGDTTTDGIVLIDVIPLTLGIEIAGGIMEPMIKRNTSIPVEIKKTFTNYSNNQPSITIKVYEGERPLTEHNNLLGKFELTGLPHAPKGKLKIDVIFSVDANGIMNISAKELSSGIQNKLHVNGGIERLTNNDIIKMINDAEQYKENDIKIKGALNAKNLLENYVTKIRRFTCMDEFKKKIEPDKLSDLLDTIEDITQWIDNNDILTINDYDEQHKLLQSIAVPLMKIL